MSKRILLGGLLGGVVLFCWGAVSHMVLGLGGVGMRGMPNEAAVVSAMHAGIPEPGLYFFPWRDMSRTLSEAEEKEWEGKMKAGPTGLLVYSPGSGEAMSMGQLGREFASNIAIGLIAAFLLAQATALSGFVPRALFVMLLGLLPGANVDFSYWNWYNFPANYTLGVMTDHLLGYLLMGAVLAAIVKKQQ